MEKAEKLSKVFRVIMCILTFVVIFNLIIQVIALFSIGEATVVLLSCAISNLALLYYIFIGYKKPHGNVMKYVFLLFALSLMLEAVGTGSADMSGIACGYGLAALLVAFMGGRLNKYADATTLSIVIFIIIAAVAIAFNFSLDPVLSQPSRFMALTEWVAISGAYFVRFRAHKEAGMLDKIRA